MNISLSQDRRHRHDQDCPHCPHYHPLNCKPTTDCLANGGYCIRNNHKEDCDGLLFSRECRSPLCSCCVEATLNRDECQEMPGVCSNGTSVCQDKDVGYECVCNAGFETTVCGDINECDSPNTTCLMNEKCTNTQGSYTCENSAWVEVAGEYGGTAVTCPALTKTASATIGEEINCDTILSYVLCSSPALL